MQGPKEGRVGVGPQSTLEQGEEGTHSLMKR